MLEARAIYLAGPIDGCTHAEMWDWRTEATGLLAPMKCFNPCVRHFEWGPGVNGRAHTAKEVVTLDKAEIAASDGVLAWYNPPAAGSRMTGTTMEIIHAFERGKLVVLVTQEDNLSAWIEYHVHRIFRDLEPACEFMHKFYG